MHLEMSICALLCLSDMWLVSYWLLTLNQPYRSHQGDLSVCNVVCQTVLKVPTSNRQNFSWYKVGTKLCPNSFFVFFPPHPYKNRKTLKALDSQHRGPELWYLQCTTIARKRKLKRKNPNVVYRRRRRSRRDMWRSLNKTNQGQTVNKHLHSLNTHWLCNIIT